MGRGKTRDPHLVNEQHCSHCGSKEVRYLRRTRTIYCRVCGYEWDAHWIDPPAEKVKRRLKKGE